MPESLLLSFFKALADANRLRIVGLLADRPHTVEELAEVLDLRASTISHHVSKLMDAGLVVGRPDGHYHVYSLDTEALEAMARKLLATDDLHRAAASDVDPYDRKVLAAFTDAEGRLTALPMKRKKFEAVLRHALKAFEPGQEYSEREVNERILPLTDDVASIRRGFIDHGLMVRDAAGSRYRLA